MNKFEKEEIKHQIYLEMYKNNQSVKILEFINTANSKIAKFLQKTDGVYTKKRYKEVISYLSKICKELKDNVNVSTEIDNLIDYEIEKEIKILRNNIDLKVKLIIPSREQIKTSAMFKPIVDNLSFESYLNSFESGLYNLWDNQVRVGYLSGISTKQIVRNVLGDMKDNDFLYKNGLMSSLRNSLLNNTRTMLQSFANETRMNIYKENENYFGDNYGYKYEFLATLDSRTCLVCGNYDGKKFKSIKDTPLIPIHRCCRCLVIPVLKGDVEDLKSSEDGYVSSKVTFSDWLETQNENVKKEVLGSSRYKMYKNGVKINNFINNNKVLTLEELKSRL